jgi:hypothetical protein
MNDSHGSARRLLPCLRLSLLLAGAIGCGGGDLSEPCGGLGGVICAAGEYCAYQGMGECGITDANARCRALPSACDYTYDPVCGCDIKTYDNSCRAAQAGYGYISTGACP